MNGAVGDMVVLWGSSCTAWTLYRQPRRSKVSSSFALSIRIRAVAGLRRLAMVRQSSSTALLTHQHRLVDAAGSDSPTPRSTLPLPLTPMSMPNTLLGTVPGSRFSPMMWRPLMQLEALRISALRSAVAKARLQQVQDRRLAATRSVRTPELLPDQTRSPAGTAARNDPRSTSNTGLLGYCHVQSKDTPGERFVGDDKHV